MCSEDVKQKKVTEHLSEEDKLRIKEEIYKFASRQIDFSITYLVIELCDAIAYINSGETSLLQPEL